MKPPDLQELLETVRAVLWLILNERLDDAQDILIDLRFDLAFTPDVTDPFVPSLDASAQERRELRNAMHLADERHATDLLARQREARADRRELRAVNS